jgi:hypothetical protein
MATPWTKQSSIVLAVAGQKQHDRSGHCGGCGGNARDAGKALIVANEFLETQVEELQAAVSNGYARGKFEPVPCDRKDWYD